MIDFMDHVQCIRSTILFKTYNYYNYLCYNISILPISVEVLFKPEECVIGDIIGCNVTLSEDGSHPLTALIQFYKNSVVQYKKLIDLTSDGLCFAVEFTTVGKICIVVCDDYLLQYEPLYHMNSNNHCTYSNRYYDIMMPC